MTPELIVAKLLNDATITALVGDRVACKLLPQNSNYPAIVYSVISFVWQPHLNVSESQMAQARIQVNPLATTIAEIKAIHAAVKSLLAWQRNVTVVGKKIIVIKPDALGPLQKDDELGLWTQYADYLMIYYP